MTGSTDQSGFEAEIARIETEIASLSPRASLRAGPRRGAPAGVAAQIVVLNRQLATARMQLARAKAARPVE